MNILEKEIPFRLNLHGFEVYIVGGAVRDFFLGKIPKDYDFATNAKPNDIEQLFKDKNICIVGKTFKVVMVDGIEVATYRKDKQVKMFHAKHCKPEYASTIEEDLSRRDLTINALALKYPNDLPDEIVIIDIYNGQKDLVNKVIKMVGDPYERINQDPTRILRAARFFAAIEGKFHPETLQALQDCAHYIKQYVEPERIRIEILKAMELETPSLFFSALHLIGCLKYIFPELNKCFGHTGGRYHIESLSEHCMLAGDNISPRFPLVRLAAFLHDIGKVKTYDKQVGSFLAHEEVGGRLVRQYLKKLKFSNDEVAEVSNLVHAHMRTCLGLTQKSIRKLRKYLADYGINPRNYLRLKLADRLSNIKHGSTEIIYVRGFLINTGLRGPEEQIPFTTKELALSGGEIIKYFNLKPGPIVGKCQKYLLNEVINFGESCNTKENLLFLTEIFLEENK